MPQGHFFRFFYAPPRSYVLAAKRHELACPVSPNFLCSSGVVMYGLNLYMYIYDWHGGFLSTIICW